MECVLSNSGLVVGSDGKEYLLFEIIKKFRDSYDYSAMIKYNEQEGILSIDIIHFPNSFDIKFNEEQKVAFEGKTLDSNIKQLQNLLLDYEQGELLRQYREIVPEWVPQLKKKTINPYVENLNEELLKTGAEVVKNGVKVTWPYILLGLSIPIWGSLGSFDYANWDEVVRMLFSFSLVGADVISAAALINRLINRFEFHSSPDSYKDTINSIERFKRILKKKSAIKDHLNDKEQEEPEESFSDFLEKENNKDNAKVQEYEDQFLKEANDVLNNLNKLPDKMQSKYRKQLSDILIKYQKQVNELLERVEGKVVLGEAANVWQIFMEILPELNKINYDITMDLKVVNEQKRFNAEIEKFQQALADGYTEGYSDDLENGGVAYQRKG